MRNGRIGRSLAKGRQTFLPSRTCPPSWRSEFALSKPLRTPILRHRSTVQKGNNNSRADYAVHQTAKINTSNGAPTSSLVCGHCKGRHFIGYCPTFLKLAASKRISAVKDAQLCSNCLRPGHTLQSCPSGARRKKENCGQPHHTVLHPAQSKPQNFQESPAPHGSGTGLASYTTQVGN